MEEKQKDQSSVIKPKKSTTITQLVLYLCLAVLLVAPIMAIVLTALVCAVLISPFACIGFCLYKYWRHRYFMRKLFNQHEKNSY